MNKIEITESDVAGIIMQLEMLPMAKVKNIVYFFEMKLKEVAEKDPLGKGKEVQKVIK